MTSRAVGSMMVFGTLLVAGCMGPAPETVDDGLSVVGGLADAVRTQPLALELQDCYFAAFTGVSPHHMPGQEPGMVGPFTRADMWEDAGRPTIFTVTPVVGPVTGATGNWHEMVACNSYRYGETSGGFVLMGWVGVKIEPPEFDASGIQDQWVANGIFFSDTRVVDDYAPLLGGLHGVADSIDVSPAPPGPVAIDFVMGWMGRFHGYYTATPVDNVQPEQTRYWVLAPTDGSGVEAHSGRSDGQAVGTFRPIAIDIEDRMRGDAVRYAGGGYGNHYVGQEADDVEESEIAGHPPPVAGHLGPTQGIYMHGFDRTVRLGPMPDLTFETSYTHQL